MVVSSFCRFANLVLSVLILLMVQSKRGYGARILLASVQFRSHIIMQASVGEELVLRGHHVYLAVGSRYPRTEQDALRQLGFQIITYHVPSDELFGVSDDAEKELAKNIFHDRYDTVEEFKLMSAAVSKDCEYMLTDESFLQQVRTLNFDMALIEPFILNPCVVLLPYNLNIRFVSLTVFYLPWDIRLPALPPFVHLPAPYATGPQQTVWNSFLNALIYLGIDTVFKRTLWNDTLLRRHSSGHLTWSEITSESELFILESDHHLSYHLPLFPNVIRLSGVTVKQAKPLPEELENLLQQSSEGVVLVSFGSAISFIPEHVIVKFLETFGRLEQTVVARLVVPDGVEVPVNVHAFRWLPQNDILGHRQTKLFITHCGSNGQHEATYHGVPMLGFPLFAEQPSNCDRARVKGFGLSMNIHDFTSEEMFANVKELLTNRTYSANIKRMSAIIRDEPLVGPKKAAHWIEHALKYGSKHLRSPAMDMPLYRFLMLDVLGLLASIVFVIMAFGCGCFVVLYKKLIREKTTKKKLQ